MNPDPQVGTARDQAARVGAEPASAPVVAVDGPSGSGKSSAARGVAARLGFRYLDTGAMYRAVTWWMLNQGIDVNDAARVADRADHPGLEIGVDPAGPTIAVDGVDVAGPIRDRVVSNAVSAVSAVPAIRERLVALQRELIGTGGIVVEGRDIGTVVAPEAAVKVFLTAAADERARRRAAELQSDNAAATQGRTVAELARRDHLDSTRTASPLTEAGDAVVLDTTALDLEQVIDRISTLVEQVRGRA